MLCCCICQDAVMGNRKVSEGIFQSEEKEHPPQKICSLTSQSTCHSWTLTNSREWHVVSSHCGFHRELMAESFCVVLRMFKLLGVHVSWLCYCFFTFLLQALLQRSADQGAESSPDCTLWHCWRHRGGRPTAAGRPYQPNGCDGLSSAHSGGVNSTCPLVNQGPRPKALNARGGTRLGRRFWS